ncbi:nucleotide exchange factor GrpE [Saccharothrix sp. MB29]|nr:nucleotide exchange factor GrpE [Saccharothrix sp. MB29]
MTGPGGIGPGGNGTEGGSAASDDGVETLIAGELLDQALAERRALVQLCLYALDRARSSGVVERLEEGLAGIGVTALRPDGSVRPVAARGGGTVPTQDVSLDGVVAETEVVGFADRGRTLRAPVVTVYTSR